MLFSSAMSVAAATPRKMHQERGFIPTFSIPSIPSIPWPSQTNGGGSATTGGGAKQTTATGKAPTTTAPTPSAVKSASSALATPPHASSLPVSLSTSLQASSPTPQMDSTSTGIMTVTATNTMAANGTTHNQDSPVAPASIAGIVVASVATIGMVIGLGLFLFYRRKKSSSDGIGTTDQPNYRSNGPEMMWTKPPPASHEPFGIRAGSAAPGGEKELWRPWDGVSVPPTDEESVFGYYYLGPNGLSSKAGSLPLDKLQWLYYNPTDMSSGSSRSRQSKWEFVPGSTKSRSSRDDDGAAPLDNDSRPRLDTQDAQDGSDALDHVAQHHRTLSSFSDGGSTFPFSPPSPTHSLQPRPTLNRLS